MNENFFVPRRVELMVYEIKAVGQAQALRVMAGQPEATHQQWGEFTVSMLLCDLFQFMNSPVVFVLCMDGEIYPFEELFLPANGRYEERYKKAGVIRRSRPIL